MSYYSDDSDHDSNPTCYDTDEERSVNISENQYSNKYKSLSDNEQLKDITYEIKNLGFAQKIKKSNNCCIIL
jgi:hypothetical protein